MVAEEVKNKVTPLERAELRRVENWDRWKRALLALSENLQRQIESIEADSESDQKRYSSLDFKFKKLNDETQRYYNEKATRINRFKYHVDRRLDEVCVMIETGESTVEDGWKEVDFYRRAIIAHRTLMRDFDLEDTAIDRSLWECLDSKWTFDSINNDNL
jgi:predicted nuclease with TOPRIM domain